MAAPMVVAAATAATTQLAQVAAASTAIATWTAVAAPMAAVQMQAASAFDAKARGRTSELEPGSPVSVLKLGKAHQVANVVGSTPGTWIRYWERHSRCFAKTCSVYGCSNPAMVGGHIYIKGHRSNKECYIVPLCSRCNRWGSSMDWDGSQTDWADVKEGTLAVSVPLHATALEEGRPDASNPWNDFLKEHAGQGYTKAQLQAMYHGSRAHPELEEKHDGGVRPEPADGKERIRAHSASTGGRASNPWNDFQAKHKGQGHTKSELQTLYHEAKSREQGLEQQRLRRQQEEEDTERQHREEQRRRDEAQQREREQREREEVQRREQEQREREAWRREQEERERISYRSDGGIDRRCSAVRGGDVFFKSDGSVDKRCAAYRRGLLD
mmetsp:Transcript_69066/g.202188  ORF Transcript_69066/g.202188 Transcript_69066/m.202188 type:complete len:384 (+) Transcript_69066:278-1429(+)